MYGCPQGYPEWGPEEGVQVFSTPISCHNNNNTIINNNNSRKNGGTEQTFKTIYGTYNTQSLDYFEHSIFSVY